MAGPATEAPRGTRSMVSGGRDEAPDNQLPALLDAGQLVWRGVDIAIIATAFLVYTTGIEFQIIGRSSRIQFNDQEIVNEVRAGLERGAVASIGSLSFDTIGTSPVIFAMSHREHHFRASAWLPLPDDGDVELFLEWPTQGIAYEAFHIEREDINAAVGKVVSLW
jgi:hypothetical protein